jgi:fructokinase
MNSSEAHYRLGIDLGGTKIEGIVLDGAGAELLRERIDTEAAGGYEHIVARVALLHSRLAKRVDGASYTLGIGTPGAVSAATGRMKNSNTVALNGRPLERDIGEKLGRGFRIENDANCFALAEAQLGAGAGYRIVFGVIIGTGCGGGIVADGRLHTGRNRIAGEWGHTVIDPRGPSCYCGARGCVETWISGSGLERRYREQRGRTEPANDNKVSSGEHIVAGGDQPVSAGDIVARWRKSEADATAVMGMFFEHLGQALANLINVLDPDVVVLGGGLSNIAELYSRGVNEVRRRVFGDTFDTPIVKHTLGDAAGVIGAALIGI